MLRHFALYILVFLISVYIGALHAFTPFGFLFLLPILVLLAGALVTRVKGNRRMSSILNLSTCIGSCLSLIVVFLSSFILPVGHAKYYYWETLPSVARAGIPFAVIEIPPGSLGSNLPPTAMWTGILANHIFWLVMGLLFALFLIRRDRRIIENTSKSGGIVVAALISLIATLSQIGLFIFWFD